MSLYNTVWGGNLSKLFCKLFSESSPVGVTATAVLPKEAMRSFRKYITKLVNKYYCTEHWR